MEQSIILNELYYNRKIDKVSVWSIDNDKVTQKIYDYKFLEDIVFNYNNDKYKFKTIDDIHDHSFGPKWFSNQKPIVSKQLTNNQYNIVTDNTITIIGYELKFTKLPTLIEFTLNKPFEDCYLPENTVNSKYVNHSNNHLLFSFLKLDDNSVSKINEMLQKHFTLNITKKEFDMFMGFDTNRNDTFPRVFTAVPVVIKLQDGFEYARCYSDRFTVYWFKEWDCITYDYYYEKGDHCKKALQMNHFEYLYKIGYNPLNINQEDYYWYLSGSFDSHGELSDSKNEAINQIFDTYFYKKDVDIQKQMVTTEMNSIINSEAFKDVTLDQIKQIKTILNIK